MTDLISATTIRSVTTADLDAFRVLRLDALRLHPEAFGAEYETQAAFTLQDWLDRMGESVFVAEQKGGLVGMAGVQVGKSSKAKHSGMVWGVFVRPEARGSGVGDRLVKACIEWATKTDLLILKLGVTSSNVSAIRCYTRCGFTVYGVEPASIYWGEKYYDGLLMSRRL